MCAASEVAGEAAAGLAAAYIALGRRDSSYLQAAESLYKWGASTSQSYAKSGGRGSTIQEWLYPSMVCAPCTLWHFHRPCVLFYTRAPSICFAGFNGDASCECCDVEMAWPNMPSGLAKTCLCFLSTLCILKEEWPPQGIHHRLLRLSLGPSTCILSTTSAAKRCVCMWRLSLQLSCA